MNDFLSKDDYEEPRCLLNMHPEIVPIPIRRVMDKLDDCLNRNDMESAEKHLKFWLAEAENGNDLRGKLTILNEQIGLFRKMCKEVDCLTAISSALSLADTMGIENTITYGTTLINAATGYKAFGKVTDALQLYQKAKSIYEKNLASDDRRLGGLYNNMGLALEEVKSYQDAENLYFKAIEIMLKNENGELEAAITYLNLADLVNDEKGLDEGEKEIAKYIEKADELINSEALARNEYYAFVCEKCAPVFGYYGYFISEKELDKRAREIYERT